MRIARGLLYEIIAHAREEAPNECCGVLTGPDGAITEVNRAKNTFLSPTRYKIDDGDLFRIWKAADQRGEDVTGFYHSHLRSNAYPSQTDINEAERWPGSLHLICSLAEAPPVVRAFRIGHGEIEEVELVVG